MRAHTQYVPGYAPPSRRMFCPTRYDACTLHMNAQTEPNSAALPNRPRRYRVHRHLTHLVQGLAAGLGAACHCLLESIGIDRTGQQVVDRHVVPRDLARNSGDEPGEPAARAVGESENIDRRLDRRRRDVDDAPEAPRDHAVDGRLDELDGRQHVGIERTNPRVAIPVAKIARRRTARVVDQDVRCRARGERGIPPMRRGDVAREPADALPGRNTDFVRRLAHIAFGARQDRHGDALAGERFGATAAQSLACGADQRLSPGDAKIHVVPFLSD